MNNICDKAQTDTLSRMLQHADVASHHGKFIPHHPTTTAQFYHDMHEHITFLENLSTFSVSGLHKEVLSSIIPIDADGPPIQQRVPTTPHHAHRQGTTWRQGRTVVLFSPSDIHPICHGILRTHPQNTRPNFGKIPILFTPLRRLPQRDHNGDGETYPSNTKPDSQVLRINSNRTFPPKTPTHHTPHIWKIRAGRPPATKHRNPTPNSRSAPPSEPIHPLQPSHNTRHTLPPKPKQTPPPVQHRNKIQLHQSQVHTLRIRIKHNSTRPNLTDTRQFFPPIQK